MSTMRPLVIVVAMTPNRLIGVDGKIPWHYPEDMKHFREVTRGHAIIMGRKTHESIGKALPGRRNIVVSRNTEFVAAGCEVVTTFEEAVYRAQVTDGEPCVIGGGEIYARALPVTTRMYITLVPEHEIDANSTLTYFPDLKDEWRTAGAQKMLSETCAVHVLDRILP